MVPKTCEECPTVQRPGFCRALELGQSGAAKPLMNPGPDCPYVKLAAEKERGRKLAEALEEEIAKRYRIGSWLERWYKHALDAKEESRRAYHYALDQLMEYGLIPYEGEAFKDWINKVRAHYDAAVKGNPDAKA